MAQLHDVESPDAGLSPADTSAAIFINRKGGSMNARFKFCICALLWYSCSHADYAGVAVQVSGLGADAVTIRARLSLDGRQAMQPEEFHADLSQLGFKLPDGAMGLLAVDLDALDKDQCVVARGHGETQIEGPRRYVVAVPLNGLANRACTSQPLCNGGFCWEYPLPQGNRLRAIWGFAANDVWAVGEAGSIIHWNGTVWSGVQQPTNNVLLAIWGSGPKDVWAVGDLGTILHWDGSTWSAVPSQTMQALFGVWGSRSSDIWAVGDAAVLRWDGAKWSSVPAIGGVAHWSAVWGTARNAVYAVGDGGTIASWNGTQWQKVGTPAVGNLSAIWGISASDAWAGGQDGMMLHWDGASWSRMDLGSMVNITGIWGSAKDDVWATTEALDQAIWHWDGTRWTKPSATNQSLFGVWGSDKSHVWGVGAGQTIVNYDGTQWSPAISQDVVGVFGFYASSPSDIWAAGGNSSGGVFLHYDGTTWTNWAKVDPKLSNLGFFAGLWGSAKNDIFAVSDGTGNAGGAIWHWDGQNWSDSNPPIAAIAFLDIWGSARDDVWAVGRSANLLHWNGTAWSHVPADGMPMVDFNRVWGSGPLDVWIVGPKGTVLHWDGTKPAWAVMTTPIPKTSGLAAIWGSGPNNVWIIGDDNTAYHYTGNGNWSMMPTGATGFEAMWGSGPTDIWAGGDFGILIRWDGYAWSRQPRSTAMLIRGIYGLDNGDVLFGGGRSYNSFGNGIVRYRRPM